MLLRIYTVNQKYVKNKHGDIGVYRKKIKKWIKSKKPYRPQKRGLEKKSIHSTRFGFLELYNRKEQQELICPSGYSISQCFNVLKKLWYAYHKARETDKDIHKMEKYAKAIQDVQKDMGIKTTSFPHLGIYGDVFVLNPKNGERMVFEDQSALKQKQDEFEKWQAENSKKIQEKLLKPDKEKGEEIETFADDVYPYEMEDNEETVPELLKPDEKKGEEILTITDDLPFQKKLQKPNKKKGESILTIADDVAPHEIIEADIEDTVPELLEPEEGEEILTIADDLPFHKKLQKPNKKKGEAIITIADDVAPHEMIEADIEDTVPELLEPEEGEEILTIADDTPFQS
jgi:hypothetical protein